MDKKAEFTTQNFLYTMLYIGLVLGVFGAIIAAMSSTYDITGYDEDEFSNYDYNQNISSKLQSVYDDVDVVTVDSSWFDFFSGIWSKFLAPFQFIIRSVSYMVTIIFSSAELFQLLPVFAEFLWALLFTAVVIGIVLIKFGLGRKK